MKKVALDLLEFVRGSGDFMPLETAGDPWLYPIDLEFTLRDEARHYSPKDAEGLPITRYQSIGDQYNPTRVAAFALSHWNRWRGSGTEASRSPFLRSAQWFRDTADDGRWFYRFDWGELKAPWISGLAQGEGISVLTRAALQSGDPSYGDAAQRALPWLTRGIADGGVLGHLPDGRPFFEEYPIREPVHVLNGYLFALIGILDLQRMNPSSSIAALLDEARITLERNLHRWDVKDWSTYDLHQPDGGQRNLCTSTYHRLHATQLRYLGTALGSDFISRRADSWARSGERLTKRVMAAVGKIRYRLRHRPQR